MRFDPPLAPAVFVGRENRYLALVERAGCIEPVHVPNSGLMSELLVPGAPARIAPAGRAGRKTAWDLILIEHEGSWVSVDARLPPRLVAEALGSGILRLPGCPSELRREVTHGGSRFDLAAPGPDGILFVVEAKSVNLVEEGVALFPDVPTARGARHCRHLAALSRQGGHGAIVFVIQRADAARLAPHRAADPDFAEALAEAQAAGVLVRAIRCRVSEAEITAVSEVPVELR